MQQNNYVPVGNFQSAVPKFENLFGFALPDELLAHYEKYNLGSIDDVTFYGLSVTVEKHHNLLIGYPSIRGLSGFPSNSVPILDYDNKIFSYDVSAKAVNAYDMTTGDVSVLTLTLDELIDSALETKVASLESAPIVPEQKLNSLCRFVKNEIEQKDRTYIIAIALAYSLEVDLYSENVLAHYGDYFKERVDTILGSMNERVLLDLPGALELTRNIYLARCETVRVIPSTVTEHLKELDEKSLATARQLSFFFKDLAR